MSIEKKITYKESGVDLEKSDLLASILSTRLNSNNFKNFAGLYSHPLLSDYCLAATTDGIGTKMIPLLEYGRVETAAIDLVAMNLNDLACVGATPLFFLDYIAANMLDVEMTSKFIYELKNELLKYGTTLIGGETSELSDFIKSGIFDAAGFAVGIVKKDKIIDPKNIKENDVVIALKSSGPHSNGFSLIRKLYSEKLIDEETFKQTLVPTRIYINDILKLSNNGFLTGAANITGGGICSNLKRIIPNHLVASLEKSAMPISPLFSRLASLIEEEEAFRAFNMGVGFIVTAKQENVEKVMGELVKYEPFIFGEVIKDDSKDSKTDGKKNTGACFR